MIKIIKQKDLTDIPDYSESRKEDDGQPRDNFYVPTIMTDIDVIENILDKFSKAGVTHKFSGDDLIITALTTSHLEQEKVLDDLRYTLADVVKQLKQLYKEATGKTLSIEKEKSSVIDAVSNYTTGHMGLYKVTNTYELPKSPSSDDKSLEKHELNEDRKSARTRSAIPIKKGKINSVVERLKSAGLKEVPMDANFKNNVLNGDFWIDGDWVNCHNDVISKIDRIIPDDWKA